MSSETARLRIQCAGSVDIDGESMGALPGEAYDYLAGLVPEDLPFSHGDSVTFELRLVRFKNTPAGDALNLTGVATSAALHMQIRALIIDGWRQAKAERSDLADGMFMGGNKSYQQGYADALDSCVQALKRLTDAP